MCLLYGRKLQKKIQSERGMCLKKFQVGSTMDVKVSLNFPRKLKDISLRGLKPVDIFGFVVITTSPWCSHA